MEGAIMLDGYDTPPNITLSYTLLGWLSDTICPLADPDRSTIFLFV